MRIDSHLSGDQDANKNKANGKIPNLIKAAILGINMLTPACSDASGQDAEVQSEDVNKKVQALISDGFEAPVKLPAAINDGAGQQSPTVADDGNGHWIIYYVNHITDPDIYKTVINKSDFQVVENPAVIQGADTPFIDDDHLQSYNNGNKAYLLSGGDLSDCDLGGNILSNCSSIPNNIGAYSFYYNPATSKFYVATAYYSSLYAQPYYVTVGQSNWQEMTNCIEPGFHNLVSFVDDKNFIYGLDTGFESKIKYKPINSQGTDCVNTPSQLIDSTPGSAQINKAGSSQGGAFFVPEGMFYHSSEDGATGYDLYFAKFKAVTQVCGNNVKEGTEGCDNGTNNTNTPCAAPYGGTCNYCDTSCAVHTVTGPFCGDGLVNGAEACDGTNFGGKTCATYGFSQGNLSCSSCAVVTSGCSNPPEPQPEAGVDAETGTDAAEEAEAGEDAQPEPQPEPQPEAGVDAETGTDAAEEAEAGEDAAEEADAAKDCGLKLVSGDCEVSCDTSGKVTVTHPTTNTECKTEVSDNADCTITTTKLQGSKGDAYTVLGSDVNVPQGMNRQVKQVPPAHCFSAAHTGGIDMGMEGTDPVVVYNPNLQNGQAPHVATVTVVEGQIKLAKGGKPLETGTTGKPCKNSKPCEPGQMPQGATYNIDETNPEFADLADAAPDVIEPQEDAETPEADANQPVVVPPEGGGDGGGCSVCSIKTPGEGQDSTRNALFALGLVAAITLARRKR